MFLAKAQRRKEKLLISSRIDATPKSQQETEYLTRSKTNAQDLLDAVKEIKERSTMN